MNEPTVNRTTIATAKTGAAASPFDRAKATLAELLGKLGIDPAALTTGGQTEQAARDAQARLKEHFEASTPRTTIEALIARIEGELRDANAYDTRQKAIPAPASGRMPDKDGRIVSFDKRDKTYHLTADVPKAVHELVKSNGLDPTHLSEGVANFLKSLAGLDLAKAGVWEDVKKNLAAVVRTAGPAQAKEAAKTAKGDSFAAGDGTSTAHVGKHAPKARKNNSQAVDARAVNGKSAEARVDEQVAKLVNDMGPGFAALSPASQKSLTHLLRIALSDPGSVDGTPRVGQPAINATQWLADPKAPEAYGKLRKLLAKSPPDVARRIASTMAKMEPDPSLKGPAEVVIRDLRQIRGKVPDKAKADKAAATLAAEKTKTKAKFPNPTFEDVFKLAGEPQKIVAIGEKMAAGGEAGQKALACLLGEIAGRKDVDEPKRNAVGTALLQGLMQFHTKNPDSPIFIESEVERLLGGAGGGPGGAPQMAELVKRFGPFDPATGLPVDPNGRTAYRAFEKQQRCAELRAVLNSNLPLEDKLFIFMMLYKGFIDQDRERKADELANMEADDARRLEEQAKLKRGQQQVQSDLSVLNEMLGEAKQAGGSGAAAAATGAAKKNDADSGGKPNLPPVEEIQQKIAAASSKISELDSQIVHLEGQGRQWPSSRERILAEIDRLNKLGDTIMQMVRSMWEQLGRLVQMIFR